MGSRGGELQVDLGQHQKPIVGAASTDPPNGDVILDHPTPPTRSASTMYGPICRGCQRLVGDLLRAHSEWSEAGGPGVGPISNAFLDCPI
jgi:hypothetical protein